jgi:hypothetical protein
MFLSLKTRLQGRMPSENLGPSELKSQFAAMGFTTQELVAISGARALIYPLNMLLFLFCFFDCESVDDEPTYLLGLRRSA